MSTHCRSNDRRVAFIPIGVAFMVIGLNGPTAFIGVGAGFLAIGLAALRRRREDAGRP